MDKNKIKIETTITTLPPVTMDELADFLLTKYKHCGVCGDSQFFINATNDKAPFKAVDHNIIENFYIESYVTICKNCGHLSFFVKGFIDNEINKVKLQNEVK
ncbi:MAG: hypothetical protein K2Y14_03990 [Burkholderiales bacterium]|nr:hypothetical protein [Burkholderiales bacterium]